MKLAEYIWIDGTDPTPLIRSKTKVLQNDEEPPLWSFDGSSTNQASGDNSDCVLKPVTVTNDPLRGGDNILVLCEVYNTDMTPHETNTRAKCAITAQEFQGEECWYGLEQEQTHLYCCLQAGLKISGINAEVCPGQWEFQVGPCSTVEVGDHLWLARYLLERIGERFEVEVSFSGKPLKGDWNGAGCHANFSTKQMRENYDACVAAVEALGNNTAEHIKNYGHGIEDRLTGKHETCSHEEFKYGVSDRTASIRIPWQVAKDQKGYIEDRRPNANCDPYVVTRLITKSVCGD